MTNQRPAWYRRPRDEADLIEQCRQIIKSARRDLGQDVGGLGLLNLLADNTEETLGSLRKVLDELGESEATR